MKTTNIKRLLAILILLTGWSFQCHAFERDNPVLLPFLVNEFELRNQNWAISQCPESRYIYFANSEGLVVYNGIRWQTNILKENLPVRSVLAHNSGKIFTGSFEEFGYWVYDAIGKLRYTSLSSLTEVENNDEIWKIYLKDERVYFQSFTSIYIYDFDTVEKVMAPYTMLFMHNPNGELVTQILENGLFRFSGNDFHKIPGSSIFAQKKVHAIIPYNDKSWMICTDNEGIYIYDGRNFNYFESEVSDFLKSFTCNAAVQLSDTTFAFGSILNGLIITDKSGDIQRTFNTGNGLKNNTVLSLYKDSDSGLWAGMDEGTNYIDLLSPYTHYKSRNGTLGTIYAMLRYKDHLYIGTNHGLFRSGIEKKGAIYNFPNLEFVPESHGQVWSLELIDDQIICGHNEGTFLVRGRRMQKISDITGGWSYIPYGDYVLGGTYTGIIVLEKGTNGQWQFRNKINNFTEPTRYLEIDYMGYLWASHHQKGIFKIELSEDFATAIRVDYYPDIDGKSYNIKVFKINNRVVFTTPEGIYTYDFVRNEIIPFEALAQNLGEFKNASHINNYYRNEYWFIKEDKLALFEIGLDFSSKKVYEISQDNINLPQRRIQPVRMDDQTLLIPNPQNFDAYNLALHHSRNQTSWIGIEKIVFYGSRDSIVFFRNLPEKKIKWNINNLTVSFSDPSLFENPGRSYFYRIPELEQSWQSTKSNHFTYLDLKHGKYTVEIRNSNNNLTYFSFIIATPWYLSKTAWVIYSLAFLVFLWGLIKFFRFEINRQKELVAMEIKQNTLEKELDYKSYELMLTMRHLLLKDKILKDLDKQITSIKEQSSKYPVKSIKNMEKIINQGLGTQSVEWENAMNNLKLSQQGFFKALKEKYPELTPNDLRLCSYLRMNFNTKEIAQLLNISTRGVEISRHRLRKKLNLSQDENLFEFLMREEFNLSE
jgi:ligand-binding sensor domain-containing protein/DNA-binding CsgD family transcriptional regulator